MPESKVFWKSKTLWVNVLVIFGVIFTEFADTLGAEGTLTVFAVVNILLRAVTKSGVSLK